LDSLNINEVTAKFDSTISDQNYAYYSVFENITDICVLLLEVMLNDRYDNGKKKLAVNTA